VVSEENAKVQTKKTEDAPADGCMPIGRHGPRQTRLSESNVRLSLKQYRGPGDPQTTRSNSPNAIGSRAEGNVRQPNQPRPVGDEKHSLNRTKASSAEANAKIEDVAGSSEAKARQGKPGT